MSEGRALVSEHGPYGEHLTLTHPKWLDLRIWRMREKSTRLETKAPFLPGRQRQHRRARLSHLQHGAQRARAKRPLRTSIQKPHRGRPRGLAKREGVWAGAIKNVEREAGHAARQDQRSNRPLGYGMERA
jgi:hypothetical protein